MVYGFYLGVLPPVIRSFQALETACQNALDSMNPGRAYFMQEPVAPPVEDQEPPIRPGPRVRFEDGEPVNPRPEQVEEPRPQIQEPPAPADPQPDPLQNLAQQGVPLPQNLSDASRLPLGNGGGQNGGISGSVQISQSAAPACGAVLSNQTRNSVPFPLPPQYGGHRNPGWSQHAQPLQDSASLTDDDSFRSMTGNSRVQNDPHSIGNPMWSSTPAPQSGSLFSSFGGKAIKPKPFKGTAGEDLDDYLSYFHTVGMSNGWSEPQYALNLSISLEDMARQVWVDENGLGPNRLSYTEIVTALRKRFSPEGQEKAYKAHFRMRSKDKNENWMAYGQALRRLSRKAFPGSRPGEQEKHAIEQFLNGLEPQMKQSLSMLMASTSLSLSRPIEMQDVITFAYEYELSTGKKAVGNKPSLDMNAVSIQTSSLDQLMGLV